MYKNTTKSATVTHENSTMLPPHYHAILMPVNNIQPWRVKFKTSNPHQPSSLDRGDHPIAKYTTFNTEIPHMQEQQPVATFARENSNPCHPGLYSFTRYFSQQQFERQLNVTPRQQGRPASARLFAKKHQLDSIVQRETQNHGQVDKIPSKSTEQMSGTLQDILPTKNMAKNTAVVVPKTNGQIPEISATTARRNSQDRAFIQQETDAAAQTTEQKQQGSITVTDRKRIQIENKAPVGSAQTWMKALTDLLTAPSQNDTNDILQDIKDIIIKERTGDFNQIKFDTIKPENASYLKDFPPLQGSPTTSAPLRAQPPPTIIDNIKYTDLNERTGDFNQIKLGTIKPKNASYPQDFSPLHGSSTTSTPLSAQSPPTIIEDNYAPSLSYQINFHLSLLTWCKAAMENHRYMAQQHHQASPGNTWQLYLSLLAHHAVNHHAYQLELARHAFILETSARLGPLENNNQAKETTTIKEREITHALILENENFFSKQLLARTSDGSPANVPTEMKRQALIAIRTYDEMLSNAATSSDEDKLKKVKDKLKKPFDKCDANGDGSLDRKETRADCLVMAKSIAKLSGQPVDKFLPNIERKLDHSPDVTKKPRARWILIKLCQGTDGSSLNHLVKADSTHFHKWAVVKTTDENYPQIVGDIQAYEAFEKQEPALDRGKKAGSRSTKTSPHNRIITKTITKVTVTYETTENNRKQRYKNRRLSVFSSRKNRLSKGKSN